MMKNFLSAATRRRGILLAAVLVLSFVLASVAYASVREVGATVNFTAPTCKRDSGCVVLTRVTAFQLKAGNRSNVSRVPRDGKVVAYSLFLPPVVSEFYTYFGNTYGGAPSVRLSVLRRAPRKGVTKYRYKLVAQSKRINVKRYLGGAPTFALDAPLEVKKGDMLAITSDTWLPALVVRAEDSASTWRASRPTGKCSAKGTDITNLTTPRMHEKLDSIKQYNCGFTGGRLLYHTTVVDTPPKTS